MKTQIPVQKQSHTIIPAGPVQAGKDRTGQARWVGAPFNTTNFRSNRLPQIQAKMRVSQPHDPMEREADETAAKVMNMPEPSHGQQTDSSSGNGNRNGTQNGNASSGSAERQSSNSTIITTKAAAPIISEVRRAAEAPASEGRETLDDEREEKEETQNEDVARKVTSSAAETPPDDSTPADETPSDEGDSAGTNSDNGGSGDPGINPSGNGGPPAVDDNVESRIRNLRGRGRPLSGTEKTFFESRFGRDFGRVRLHTDGQSMDLAKRVNAKAFAVGENIVFGRGYYQPGTRDGRELLAHELTHVVQQGKAPAIGATTGRSTSANRHNEATGTTAAPAINRSPVEGETVHRAPLGEETKGLLDKISGFADKFAGNIPGFRLVTLILGFNPITQKNVPRTALNFVGAVAALIPGGDVLFQRIQKSGVLVQAFNWLTKEFGKLGITLTLITDLLKTGLQRLKGIGLLGAAFSFITGDLFPKILRILKEVFGPTINKLINFVKKVAIKIKEFVFRGFIRLVGGREGPIFQFLNPITNLLGRIFNDPISFGRNLLGAVGKGFKQFMGNFVKHFKGALFGWMFGTFSKAGINVPKTFEPAAIFGFVAQLFAVTWTDMRAKVVKRMGPKGNTIMTAVEKSVEVVTILITKGPGGLYEKIKEDLGSLKETILGAVLTWVRNTIIVKAIVKIASLLNPAGAIVQAILAIYNVVMFFIERFEQIKALVQGIMGALQNIVLGKIGPAANKVETTMARGLTLVISFLARLVGLGNIVKPVQKVIQRIKKRIDKAIDKIIRQITVRARLLWRKFKRKAKKAAGKLKDRIVNWWRYRKGFRVKGEEHHVFVKGRPPRARLFVASEEEPVERFLERPPPEEARGPVGKLIARGKALVRGVRRLLTGPAPAPSRRDDSRRTTRTFDRIKTVVEKIMAAAGGAIQEWWKLSTDIKLKDGSILKLFFKGTEKNAELMIQAQDLKTLGVYIREDLSAKHSNDPRMREVLAKAQRVDALRRTNAPAPAADTDSGRSAEITRQYKEIVDLLKLITGNNEIAPATQIRSHGIKTFQVRGTSLQIPTGATAAPLSINPGIYKGSEADATLWNRGKKIAESKYPAAAAMKNSARERGNYVLGHIINNNTHGTGKDWGNLIPITGGLNTRMGKGPEEEVKNKVLKEKKTVSYSVRAEFGSHSGRLTAVEKELPSALVFDIREMEFIDGEWKPKSSQVTGSGSMPHNIPSG